MLQGYLGKVVAEMMGFDETSGRSAEVVQEWRSQRAEYGRAQTPQSYQCAFHRILLVCR